MGFLPSRQLPFFSHPFSPPHPPSLTPLISARQVPHLYFITVGDGGAINGIDVTPLRDFIGLEGCDDSVKQALLDFGYDFVPHFLYPCESCVRP